ncbi:unnamed protein product, partial [Ectocarpus sp. 13 AM-2016]
MRQSVRCRVDEFFVNGRVENHQRLTDCASVTPGMLHRSVVSPVTTTTMHVRHLTSRVTTNAATETYWQRNQLSTPTLLPLVASSVNSHIETFLRFAHTQYG